MFSFISKLIKVRGYSSASILLSPIDSLSTKHPPWTFYPWLKSHCSFLVTLLWLRSLPSPAKIKRHLIFKIQPTFVFPGSHFNYNSVEYPCICTCRSDIYLRLSTCLLNGLSSHPLTHSEGASDCVQTWIHMNSKSNSCAMTSQCYLTQLFPFIAAFL